MTTITRRFPVAGFVLALALFAACKGTPQTAPASQPEDSMARPSKTQAAAHAVPADARFIDRFKNTLTPGVEYHAVVELAKGGQFEITFFPETAPNHVANFVSLARQGYYNGTTFHRVLDGFMAQGGDPTGTGSGGPGYQIPAEFSNLPHVRGTVSMARTSDPNSAGSQFFICFKTVSFLDGQYTVFGQVTKGMEVVDKIKRRDPEMNPREPGDAIKEVKIVEIAPQK